MLVVVLCRLHYTLGRYHKLNFPLSGEQCRELDALGVAGVWAAFCAEKEERRRGSLAASLRDSPGPAPACSEGGTPLHHTHGLPAAPAPAESPSGYYSVYSTSHSRRWKGRITVSGTEGVKLPASLKSRTHFDTPSFASPEDAARAVDK